MNANPILEGSCHCGNIRYSLRTALSIDEFSSRRCGCSFCTKHGGRYISDPNAALEFSIHRKELADRYRFATHTADFLICLQCGIMPLVTSTIDGKSYAVININTLREVEKFSANSPVVDYDEESPEQRIERRKRNWIGTVEETRPHLREEAV